MGTIKFTKEQQQVIETRNKNILVSAAAGSGKTTVLVQRIIEKVLDANDQTDIDKILVLTFTEAAAGQMREKIGEAINKNIDMNPDNEHLMKQAVLIHNAQISTIHSFCLNLLRNNFTDIDIDPAFRVAENGEIKLVQGEVANQLIEDLFEDELVDNIELLADRFTSKNSISGLKELILNAYSVCQNAPFIDDYIEERRHDYDVEGFENLEECLWGNELISYTKAELNSALQLAELNIVLAEGEDGPYEYLTALQSDKGKIEELLKCNGYKELYEHLGGIAFDRLSTKKMADISEESKLQVKDIREKTKKIVTDLRDGLYCTNPEMIVKQMQENTKIVNILADVLQLYDERLRAEKNKRKIIDFSDMEHYALQILLKKEDDVYMPTRTALNYRKAYNEIMIDEYQDSNRIQELILSTISGEDDGVYNRFMVGDVKQSIYSFRRACPELFMDKYNTYTADGDSIRIDLSANYRSRSEVVDSVNAIFERVMGADFGEIEYDNAAYLYANASYPETGEDNTTELLILQKDKESKSDKQTQEALMVANRIKELVGKHKIYDRDRDEIRPCSYRDIVILLRSNKGWDEKFKKVLEDNGIPTYITSKTGYFSSSEIKHLLNLLQVLDNPRSEIELYGVLTNFFGGFNDNEVAAMRTLEKCELYDTLREVATMQTPRELISAELISKASRFCAFLDEYRSKVIYTPINELLAEIIEGAGYMHFIGSLPLGEQRIANVYMLLEKAKQYESASFKGLYQFIRYIREIQSYEIDFGEAVMLDENSDVVRIMSIHKSKGLEFPICFVSGMDKEYNFMDTNDSIVYDKDLGIGLDYIDTKLNAKYKDLRKAVLAQKMRRDTAAEEMRVFYVALTRAKEKLIMTACLNDVEKSINQSKAHHSMLADGEGGRNILPYYIRSKKDKYIDLVLAAIDTEKNKVIKTTVLSSEDIKENIILESVSKENRKSELKHEIENRLKNNACSNNDVETENTKNQIVFRYSHEGLERLFTKTSVSELKMAAMKQKGLTDNMEDVSHDLFHDDKNDIYIPNFIKTDESVAGTTRGTAYHRVMELFDFAGNYGIHTLDFNSQKEKIEADIRRMVEQGLIDKKDADLVDVNKIMTFMSSDLGVRMCQADKRGELFVEEPFVLGVSADKLDKAFPQDEQVLIQGIIDAFFYEDGKIVLMDYKTDVIKTPQNLIDKYATQLDYYEEALTRIRKTEVKERLIYSFALGEVISC